MKILWISHFLLYPEVGYGALQRSRNLLKELSKKHEVYLVSYYRNVDLILELDLNTAKQDLEKYCKEVILIPYPPDKSKYMKYYLMIKSILTSKSYSILLYHSKYMWEKIVNIVQEFNIDVVHADTMGLIDDLIEKLDVVTVLNHHNIESHMMQRRIKKENNIFTKLFVLKEAHQLRQFENRFCQKYDLNLVVSKIDEDRLKGINKNTNTLVVENGVDCKYFTKHLRDKNSKGLIFTGTLDWYPNSEAMLFFCKEVWPSLNAKFSDLTLTIIGKNPPKQLLSLINKENNIILIKEFVPDIREHIRNSRIFICPIRDGGGTRLKILDALAQGIPVVSTSIGCEGINVTDGEHIMIANKPAEFVKQISLLLSDEKTCNVLSTKGRSFIEENYDFSIIGRRLSGMYEKLQHNRQGV